MTIASLSTYCPATRFQSATPRFGILEPKHLDPKKDKSKAAASSQDNQTESKIKSIFLGDVVPYALASMPMLLTRNFRLILAGQALGLLFVGGKRLVMRWFQKPENKQ